MTLGSADDELATQREQEHEHQLGERDPGKCSGPTERDAGAEDEELRRHPEVRQHRQRGAVVVGEALARPCVTQPVRDETLD